MKKIEFVSSTGSGNCITLDDSTAYHKDEVAVGVSAPDGEYKGVHINGPALRDALLEAFPLPKGEPLADWEKELLGVSKPKQAPGEVYADSARDVHRFVILPEGKYYDLTLHRVYTYSDFATDSLYKRVFDPRGAKALPSPLGIRVGDRVRRTTEVEGITTTVEFEVNHANGPTGHISPKYGLSYNPKGFEVVSREVPDRLPAGTIVRDTDFGYRLYLITGDTALPLHTTWKDRDGSDFAGLVKKGRFEVIYLP